MNVLDTLLNNAKKFIANNNLSINKIIHKKNLKIF
jgi:hypothetical protein